MRIANVKGRLKLVIGDGAVDVAKASNARFDASPHAIYDRFDEFKQWAATIETADEAFAAQDAGPPSPFPTQVFAIGLNYVDHAAESGFQPPTKPVVFTKYVSAFSGPVSDVVLPQGSVDWEIEVVAVIGTIANAVPVERGWDFVAGLTAGQDISERELQRSGPAPQFGLGKSFAGFAPMGPVLVTPDEFDNADDLALGCAVNGETMQSGQTRDMIFSVPTLVSYLSNVVTLYPGDLIFTGTPPGVGMGRTPPRYLHAGDRLHSWIEGIGDLHQHCVERR